MVLKDARTQDANASVSALRKAARRATCAGSPSAGTNGGVPEVSLPGGGNAVFTQKRVVNPAGSCLHGIGIAPLRFAVPTVQGMRAGRDDALEAGLVELRRSLAIGHDRGEARQMKWSR